MSDPSTSTPPDPLDYRVIPDDDLDGMNEFRRFMNYAFQPTETFEPSDSLEDIPTQARLPDHRGLYDGDELLSTCAHHWFTLRLRGAAHAVPGLSGVSTPPQHRRQGLVRRLLVESIAEYRARDAHFSVLWPFEHPFYRRFGWGTCTDYALATCPPAALSFAEGAANGEFVELSADDWERTARVFAASVDRPLTMERTEKWWRARVFAGWEDDPYVAGWERDGRLAGYLVYEFDEPDDVDGRRLSVRELVATDHEALVNCYRYCHYHDSQVEQVRFYGPPEPTLFDLVEDPREVEVELRPGPMFRVVDIERGLASLSYPTDGALVLAVDDPLVGDNDGRFRLSVTDGTATCEATDATPDAEVGVATLSQVVAGYLSVERATTVGDLSVDDDGTSETLATLFPEPPEGPLLREFF